MTRTTSEPLPNQVVPDPSLRKEEGPNQFTAGTVSRGVRRREYLRRWRELHPDKRVRSRGPRGPRPKRFYAPREEIKQRLAAIKLESGCVDCGYRAHAIALDFDHCIGEPKSGGISRAMRDHRPWEWFERELAKCEVVCANCHRVRTLLRKQHG